MTTSAPPNYCMPLNSPPLMPRANKDTSDAILEVDEKATTAQIRDAYKRYSPYTPTPTANSQLMNSQRRPKNPPRPRPRRLPRARHPHAQLPARQRRLLHPVGLLAA